MPGDRRNVSGNLAPKVWGTENLCRETYKLCRESLFICEPKECVGKVQKCVGNKTPGTLLVHIFRIPSLERAIPVTRNETQPKLGARLIWAGSPRTLMGE